MTNHSILSPDCPDALTNCSTPGHDGEPQGSTGADLQPAFHALMNEKGSVGFSPFPLSIMGISIWTEVGQKVSPECPILCGKQGEKRLSAWAMADGSKVPAPGETKAGPQLLLFQVSSP